MFDKAMRKSIESYLQPGEQLLSCTIVQGKGMTKAVALGGVAGAAIAGARKDKQAREAAEAGDGVQLASKMGLAVTPQRVLIFKAGGAMALKAKELLTDLPIAEVDSIAVGKGAMTKPIALTVRGTEYVMEAPKLANTDELVDAFQQAKTGA